VKASSACLKRKNAFWSAKMESRFSRPRQFRYKIHQTSCYFSARSASGIFVSVIPSLDLCGDSGCLSTMYRIVGEERSSAYPNGHIKVISGWHGDLEPAPRRQTPAVSSDTFLEQASARQLSQTKAHRFVHAFVPRRTSSFSTIRAGHQLNLPSSHQKGM
jgi:hypothetical protein